MKEKKYNTNKTTDDTPSTSIREFKTGVFFIEKESTSYEYFSGKPVIVDKDT